MIINTHEKLAEGLTDEEFIHYANYSLIEECDCCHDFKQILNEHDGKDFIEFNGVQFICQKCR